MNLLRQRISNTRAARGSGPDRNRVRRGQSMVELALILPLLVVLLSVVIEGGLMLNAWIRVNTAAKDATRFAVDAARPNEIGALVLEKLAGIDFGTSKEFTRSMELDVFMIKGKTTATCTLPDGAPNWVKTQIWDGDGSSSPPESPVITRQKILTGLASQGLTNCRNVPFAIVEVHYNYTPLLATLLARGAKIPMSSYAIIQQY